LLDQQSDDVIEFLGLSFYIFEARVVGIGNEPLPGNTAMEVYIMSNSASLVLNIGIIYQAQNTMTTFLG
jgi:hypothetical protein